MHSCLVYDGSECTTIFGHANISYNPDIRASDAGLHAHLTGSHPALQNSFSYSTSCQSIVRFILCLQFFSPCSGTVWCGSSSKDALKAAAISACECSDAESCRYNGYDVIRGIDNMPYYGGSSVAYIKRYDIVVCQDVKSGEKDVWMYNYIRACSRSAVPILANHVNVNTILFVSPGHQGVAVTIKAISFQPSIYCYKDLLPVLKLQFPLSVSAVIKLKIPSFLSKHEQL